MTHEVRVRVADAAAAEGDTTLATLGLGSCVAIVLHDRERCVGGLAHILLPTPALARTTGNQAKCAITAVPFLLTRMQALGARQGRIVAKLAGGACMFSSLLPVGTLQMGERNLIATRSALLQACVPIVAEDVGGSHGRSVYFSVASGVMEVRSLARGNVVL